MRNRGANETKFNKNSIIYNFFLIIMYPKIIIIIENKEIYKSRGY